MNKGC